MKHTKQCPKCKSSKLARIEGKVGAYGSGNVILTGMSIFSAVKVTRYICVSCGFVEEWVDSQEDLETIREKFKY